MSWETDDEFVQKIGQSFLWSQRSKQDLSIWNNLDMYSFSVAMSCGRDAKLHHHYVILCSFFVTSASCPGIRIVFILVPVDNTFHLAGLRLYSLCQVLSFRYPPNRTLQVTNSIIENQCLWGVHEISFRCHRKDQVHSTPPSKRNGWPFQEL